MTMYIPEIDVYVTLQCDLRCAHCFLGPQLGHGRHMDSYLLDKLIRTARSRWKTERLTFLGGEPTLYPNISVFLAQALEAGYVVRLISNGGPGLERFLRDWVNPTLELSISLDGLESTHDSIRAKGSFRRALGSVRMALIRGLRVAAIVSAQVANLEEIPELVELLAGLGVFQVTIHFVTERGAAKRHMIPSRSQWKSFQATLAKRRFGIPVRFEPTFTDAGQSLSCQVREGKNLMFFPDGKVLHCSMFIDVPGAANYRWTREGLEGINVNDGERSICAGDPTGHCPAIHFVNPDLAREADKHGEKIGCIFHKSVLPISSSQVLAEAL